MAIYPFPAKLQSVASTMPNGNFGLWYNKYVPLSAQFKASDDRGDDTKAVEYYYNRYNQMKKSSGKLLQKKQQDQDAYCASFPQSDFEVIKIKATLKSPLIIGIGESHPHEVSMVFDHNHGIPYIPASGVKGIVRFAHTHMLYESGIPDPYLKTDENTGSEYIDDESFEAIYYLFGNQKNRGRVVFLDAYPQKVPDLHIDIMNPHYGEYYDPNKRTPPADYLKPNPIKFLTVAQGTVFIFRAIARKENDIPKKVKNALRKALAEEGVGAKTAVGYGIFEINETFNINKNNKEVKPEPGPLEKCCEPFKSIKPNEAGKIGSLIDTALKTLQSDEDKRAFANYVKDFMGSEFKKSKAREKLKSFLS